MLSEYIFPDPEGEVEAQGLETLQGLMGAGIVYKDSDEFVGKADDGVEVNLGSELSIQTLYRYIAHHPTQLDW